MSEVTNEQFERYLQSMRESVGLLEKLARQNNGNNGSRAASNDFDKKTNSILNSILNSRKSFDDSVKKDQNNRKASRDDFVYKINTATQKVGDSFRLLSGNASGLTRTFNDLTKSFAAGAIIGTVLDQMVDFGEDWIKQYRAMADVGQTFNGSISEMARQAAAAGMPLDQFSEYVKRNSKVMSYFGAKDVTQLAKSVRQITHTAGMYGYSIEGMNEVTATWLDMQRQQGNRWASMSVNSAYSSNAVAQFAKEVAELAGATGKSRDEILNATRDFAKSGEITAAMMADPRLKENPAYDGAMARIASAGENASDLLGNAFAKASLQPSRMFETGTVALMNKIGIGGSFANAMRSFVDGLKNGTKTQSDMADVEKVFVDSVMSHADTIAIQAEDMPELTRLTQAAMEIQARNVKAGKESVTQQDKITTFLTTIGDKINVFKGDLFFGFLETFSKTMEGLDKDGTLTAFSTKMRELGAVAGTVVGKLLDNDRNGLFAAFANGDFDTIIHKTASVIINMGTLFTMLAKGAFSVILGFQTLGETIFGKKAGGLIGSITAFMSFLAAKSFLNKLFSGVGSMNVAAGSVFVNGMPLGGMFGGAGGKAAGKAGLAAEGGLLSRLKGKLPGKLGTALLVAGGLAGLLGALPSFDSDKTKQTPTEAALNTVANNTATIAENTNKANQLSVALAGNTDPSKQYNTILDANGKLVPIVNGAPVYGPNTFKHARPATNASSKIPVNKGQGEGEGGFPWSSLLLAGGGAMMLPTIAKKLVSTKIGGAMMDGLIFKAASMNVPKGLVSAGRGLAKGAKGLGWFGALLEGLDYIPGLGNKELTLKNVAKSGLSLGGMALGGAVGAAAGGVGAFAGGAGGYYLGGKLGDMLLGPDDLRKPTPANFVDNTGSTTEDGQQSVATPDQPAAISTPYNDLLIEMQKTSSILESRLPPMDLGIADTKVNTATLQVLTQLMSINEVILDRANVSLRNQVVINNTLKAIRDQNAK